MEEIKKHKQLSLDVK